MREKNALNATSGNKGISYLPTPFGLRETGQLSPHVPRFSGVRSAIRVALWTGFALLAFVPLPSHAYEGAAPALSGVEEILVQSVRAGGNAAGKTCGVNEDVLTKKLVKSLKSFNTPAVSVIDAKPSKIGVARVEVIPEVMTSGSQGIECTSWVSFSVQTYQTLRVPPVETPRNVIVTYWRGGLMVTSVTMSHLQVLSDAFDRLAEQFGKQYRLDQPPPLPVVQEEKD